MGCCYSGDTRELPANIASPASITTPGQVIKHPTLGEGEYLSELQLSPTPRPLVDTTKIEIDHLSGITFVNQYLLIKDLGKGAYGKVKLALNMEDNCLYALKMVSKKILKRRDMMDRRFNKEVANDDFLTEIRVMKSLRHENVVRLFEAIDDPSNDKLLMIMEYVEGGELMSADMFGDVNRAFREEQARGPFRDLIQGLEYLHCQNIIHRDIKPGNLLLSKRGHVKLTDFGSASYCPDGNDIVSDTPGTRLFFAPEACQNGEPYSGKKADIYAAGVVLYMMIFAKTPFEGEPDELHEKIRHAKPDFTSRPNVSAELIDLLERVLCKNPAERLSLEEVMKHKWVTNQARIPEMVSSRQLIISTKQESTKQESSPAVTLSIEAILNKIPQKQYKTFKPGDYLIREGEKLNGWYLIRRGYCEATSSTWDEDFNDRMIGGATGDEDFAADHDDFHFENSQSTLLTALSTPKEAGNAPQVSSDLLHFKSLQPEEILKGVERRPTTRHAQLKTMVEAAVLDQDAIGADNQMSLSENGRPLGPGTIIGQEGGENVDVSQQTVRALDTVETVFVGKKAFEDAKLDSETQFQIRLILKRLQKIQIMYGVVHQLAALKSDVKLLEKLRQIFRKQS